MAVPESPIVSASTNIIVAQAKIATITLKAASPLFGSEPVGTVLATGTAGSNGAKIAYRWASGNISNTNKTGSVIRSENGNVISMTLSSDTGTEAATPAPGGDGWIVAAENPTRFKITKASSETMAADTYPVKIEAVAWSS